ncbi:hypothetical protein ASF61_06640 [Duganella sp. Leaf126]|uniref:hypothetical protein n=1 Tax=Duganella sp. Leaf126 TaxID=1736266 RepID=UPI0006F9F356|nr:hypothetical protein [Duganella sp. Leaf126]KQQ40425.1 hypothetical protein ASF61_06640 [Duganella sp. Leaf126]
MKKVIVVAALLIASTLQAAPVEKQCAALQKVADVVVLLKAQGAPEAEVHKELNGERPNTQVAQAIRAVYAGASAAQVKAECLADAAPGPLRPGRTSTDPNGAQSIGDVLVTH